MQSDHRQHSQDSVCAKWSHAFQHLAKPVNGGPAGYILHGHPACCPDVPCQTLSTSCRERCREVTRLPSDIHLLEQTHMHTWKAVPDIDAQALRPCSSMSCTGPHLQQILQLGAAAVEGADLLTHHSPEAVKSSVLHGKIQQACTAIIPMTAST